MLRMKRQIKVTLERREALTGYLFLIPWLVGIALFVGYPFMHSLYMSFNKVRVTGSGMKLQWIGLQNYADAFLVDNKYYLLLINVVKSSITVVPIVVLFALFVSLLLNIKFPGRMLFRAVFFLPVIFSTGEVLSEMLSQGVAGLSILDRYDIKGFIEMNVPQTFAEPLIDVLNIFVLILWYSGVQILIFLAGLQTIGKPVYEAAKIDGATPWETFWKITLPAIAPFILLNLIYTVVDMFTFPTNPILVAMYNSFRVGNYGYASAMGWMYFTVEFLLILIMLGIAKKLINNPGAGR